MYDGHMMQVKKFEPGDIVTRGAGTARWVVNFVRGDEVTLVKEGQKAKSGSTRWWHVSEIHHAR